MGLPEEAQKPEGAGVGVCVCVGTTVGTGTGVEELIAAIGFGGMVPCPLQAINMTGNNTGNNIRNGFMVFNRTSCVNAHI